MNRVVGEGRGRRLGVVAVAMAALIALAGCQSSDSASGSDGSGDASAEQTAAPAAEVKITPGDGSKNVKIAKKIKVAVTDGTITEVTATTAAGTKVKGTLSDDQATWTSKSTLSAATGYNVAVTAANADGETTEQTSSFSTLTPDGSVTAYLVPGDGWTVGVGMPIVVELSHAVDESERDSVEDALTVDTGDADVVGAWQWMSSTQVWWRPKSYWETGTNVKVTADLAGVEVADGVWGSKSETAESDFTIGDSLISTVDVTAHTMTVRKNGEVIRTIPVTTGRADMATRNGIKVIMSRETKHEMDSSTIGIDEDDPDYYNLTVKYAMRLTYSGEFIHAAPWSASSQGSANVSHGCTGMTTAEAKWLFNQSKVGDVVVFENSSRKLEWGNGYTVWNETFAQWKSA